MRGLSKRFGSAGDVAPSGAAALLLGFALACNGGSTGTSTGNPNDGSSNQPTLPGGDGRDVLPGDRPGPTTGEDHAVGGFCKGEKHVLESADTVTDAGFSAADLLAFVQGEHEEAIRWNDNEIARLGPEHGEHRVTITVDYDDGEIRWMTPMATDSTGHGGPEPAIAPAGPTLDLPAIGGCSPWLEIDVHVKVQSDGGALDESFDATLRSRSKLLASLYAAPDPDELGGAFAPEEILQPGYELVQLNLQLGFTPFGVSGQFNGIFEIHRGDSVGGAAGSKPFAEIGDTACTGFANSASVALDEMVEAATGQQVLDLVASAKDLAVSWSDGTSTTATLRFSPRQQGACVLLDDSIYDGTVLNIEGGLAVQTADGKVAANWDASARAVLGENGTFDQVKLEVYLKDLTEDPGLPGVDVSDFDGTNFAFTLAIAEDSAMGELLVTGFNFADCAGGDQAPPPDRPADMPTPEEVPPDRGASGGTAGCGGAEIVDVLTGVFTLAQ